MLTLERGSTYTFRLLADGHTFWIKTVQGPGDLNAYNDGVTNNGAYRGTITFAVPLDAPNTLYYNCQFHAAMTNRIDIVNPAGVGEPPRGSFLRVVPNPAHGRVSFQASPI